MKSPPPQKKKLSKITQPPPPIKILNTPPPTTTTHTKFNTSPPSLDTNSTTQIYIDPSTKKIKHRSYIIGNLYPPPPPLAKILT